MIVKQMKDVEPGQNVHGVETRKFHDHEHAQAVHLTLKPGEKLKRHITPVDVFFYVLEGNGIVEIGEEKQQAGKDTYIYSPAGILHCWHNESSDILRVLVVKTPKPVGKSKIL